MKPIKRALYSAVALLSISHLGAAGAQDKPTSAVTPRSSLVVGVEMSDGEVRKIDKELGKITLKHGEIKNLDMPAMTMVFQVKVAAMLDKVRVGDKVKFRAEKAGSGMVVTEIEVSPPK